MMTLLGLIVVFIELFVQTKAIIIAFAVLIGLWMLVRFTKKVGDSIKSSIDDDKSK